MDNKILERIRKLLAKAKDPASSENEMEIFMKKAQDLMMKHNLENSDIEIHPSDINKTEIFSQLAKAFGCKHTNFEWELMIAIGEFNNCKVYKGTHFDFNKEDWKSTKAMRLSIVGTAENRQIVADMYNAVVEKFLNFSNVRYKTYQQETKKFYHDELIKMGLSTKGVTVNTLRDSGRLSPKARWVSSYLLGCIDGLKQALKDQQRDNLQLDADKNAWGLIVAKHDALIKGAIPTLFKGKITSKATNSIVKFDGAAFEEGIKDGKTNPHTKQLG